MNSDGSLRQLGKNVSGMMDYTGFLVTGKGASYSGDAGGNALLRPSARRSCHNEIPGLRLPLSSMR